MTSQKLILTLTSAKHLKIQSMLSLPEERIQSIFSTHDKHRDPLVNSLILVLRFTSTATQNNCALLIRIADQNKHPEAQKMISTQEVNQRLLFFTS